eukprot:4990552-Amphidinium_carterae.1
MRCLRFRSPQWFPTVWSTIRWVNQLSRLVSSCAALARVRGGTLLCQANNYLGNLNGHFVNPPMVPAGGSRCYLSLEHLSSIRLRFVASVILFTGLQSMQMTAGIPFQSDPWATNFAAPHPAMAPCEWLLEIVGDDNICETLEKALIHEVALYCLVDLGNLSCDASRSLNIFLDFGLPQTLLMGQLGLAPIHGVLADMRFGVVESDMLQRTKLRCTEMFLCTLFLREHNSGQDVCRDESRNHRLGGCKAERATMLGAEGMMHGWWPHAPQVQMWSPLQALLLPRSSQCQSKEATLNPSADFAANLADLLRSPQNACHLRTKNKSQ